jgi:hypothetical protein
MSAVSWWGYGITFLVLFLLLGGMYALVRFMSDDSGKYEELKAMMDPLFHTPSFLRPGTDSGDGSAARTETAASKRADESFEDECPACRQRVTHENADCPSCGLRLL